MAKSLKDRICEGLEDRQGLIVPVIRNLMAEAYDEGFNEGLEPHDWSNPYRPTTEKEQRNDGSEAVRPR